MRFVQVARVISLALTLRGPAGRRRILGQICADRYSERAKEREREREREREEGWRTTLQPRACRIARVFTVSSATSSNWCLYRHRWLVLVRAGARARARARAYVRERGM